MGGFLLSYECKREPYAISKQEVNPYRTMASGEDTTGVSCVKQIPEHLLGFVQSQILQYVGQAKDFSAEIHEIDGQTARLVFYQGRTSSKYTTTLYS